MFYQFLANNMETLRRLSAVSLIVALVFVPLYPLQVLAEDAPPEDAPVAEEIILTSEPEPVPVTEIVTGDATAETETVSQVNLNVVESDGFLYLLNNFLQSLGHIDLRLFTSSETPPDNPCGTPTCDDLA